MTSAELAAPSLMVGALFQIVNLINSIQTMPPQIITHKAFEASKEMATIEGTKGSWHSLLMKWLNNVLDIKKLTIFQYYKTLQNYEQNKVRWQDL